MILKIEIRQIDENELGNDCPFLPETEDYEAYVRAFVEDVELLQNVLSTSIEGSVVKAYFESNSSFENNKKGLEKVLRGDVGRFIRLVSVDEYHE